MGLWAIVAIAAAAAVAVIWLAVSFSSPGRTRTLLEWLGATALYVTLASLFTHLFLEAREAGSLVGQIGFGLLLFIFASGFLVTLFQMTSALRGTDRGPTSATH